jgi:hypothetical protein
MLAVQYTNTVDRTQGLPVAMMYVRGTDMCLLFSELCYSLYAESLHLSGMFELVIWCFVLKKSRLRIPAPRRAVMTGF